MNLFQLVSVIGFPLLMLIGGIAAWRASKRENGGFVEEKTKAAQWRDESLDEWRSSRATGIEAEREARVAVQPDLHEGTGGDAGETKRHQRIGG